MRKLTGMIVMSGLLAATSVAVAQRPRGRGGAPKSADAADLVKRMMDFDEDKDGTLTKAEVTDARLHRLFDRADADKDGNVTKAELTALAAKEPSSDRGGRPGFGGRGFGPPGGGPGGPMMGGPPRPGEVLPPMLQQRLRLNAKQRKQIDALQKQVDAKLDTILTADQKDQLSEIRERGPGGFGPPGGRPPGPPGGPPPGPGGPLPGPEGRPDDGDRPDDGNPPPPPPDQPRF